MAGMEADRQVQMRPRDEAEESQGTAIRSWELQLSIEEPVWVIEAQCDWDALEMQRERGGEEELVDVLGDPIRARW
jgi:hypothetical protein